MYAAFVVVSAHCANTFLAYFVGTDRLVDWTFSSPALHPTAFVVFAVVTAMMFFDFAYWREQMCTLVCPYGRFQAVLLDRDSLVVGYDKARGEPRGKRGNAAATGDCIDCTLCVQTCPTGIDIRDGLQLECIHCAQCIDACDAVMTKIGRAPGLIRYSSQNRLEKTARRRMRPRLIFYPLLLAAVLTGLVMLLAMRRDALVVQLRTEGTPYAVADDGTVTSTVRLRIDNRTREPRTYRIEPGESTVLREPVEVAVEPTQSGEARVHVLSREPDFIRGRRVVHLRVVDGKSYDEVLDIPVIGPFGALGAKEKQ
jgi:cytochrome c oxidase accessory protein FixG